MCLTISSHLKLVELEIRLDKKHYIVEDLGTGEFYEMPEVCIDAIHLINDGIPLEDIEKQLKIKYPDEDVDLLDFANQLKELKLIAEIDGVEVEKRINLKGNLGFLWISPKVGKFFFNKISFIIYGLLMVVNIALLIENPCLFPHYKDLFISKYMVLNIPAWFILLYSLLLIHEFGHVLAMRANHFPSKLSVGHRLFIVVLETDVTAVWKLPSKKRYEVFLAGLCFDTVIFTFALSAQLFFQNGPAIFLSIMHIIVLDIVIRIGFQCCVYMKTDLYFVLANLFGSYNLMESAQQVIRSRIPFLKRLKNEEVTFESEKRIVFFYSLFYFIGVLLTISIFVFYFIPQFLYGWRNVLPGYTMPPTSLAFWDSALFTLQIVIFLTVLLNSWKKKYRQT